MLSLLIFHKYNLIIYYSKNNKHVSSFSLMDDLLIIKIASNWLWSNYKLIKRERATKFGRTRHMIDSPWPWKKKKWNNFNHELKCQFWGPKPRNESIEGIRETELKFKWALWWSMVTKTRALFSIFNARKKCPILFLSFFFFLFSFFF